MNIQYRCGALKERVAAKLQEPLDMEKDAILIAALYEMSRTILHELGRPRKSQEYLDDQGAVLELISFIAISLIRSTQDSRGVAVLTEIAEGCLDPLLKKKLSVYAQELLAKSCLGTLQGQGRSGRRRLPCLLGLGAVAVFALYLALPATLPFTGKEPGVPEAILTNPGVSPMAYQLAAPQSASAGAANAASGSGRELAVSQAELPAQPAPEQKSGNPQAETVTRVKVVNNQILVPVTLKNGGESVRVELLLDTGSTRTSIHEGLAGRLRIDLRQARTSQSEVADGRLIRSRSASIDSLGVGPFTMNAPDLDLIAYKGNDGLHDGLLGMDFLAKHRYQIDMERELIRWF